MDETNDIPNMQTTTYLAVIFKNLLYFLIFLFTPVLNWLITVLPAWKDFIENFKLIGGAIIVVLVIIKLLLEIKKVNKK